MLQLHLLSFHAYMAATQFVCACAVIANALLMNHLDGKPSDYDPSIAYYLLGH